jgi:hypothetical protein
MGKKEASQVRPYEALFQRLNKLLVRATHFFAGKLLQGGDRNADPFRRFHNFRLLKKIESDGGSGSAARIFGADIIEPTAMVIITIDPPPSSLIGVPFLAGL